jgi:ribosome-binding factor A
MSITTDRLASTILREMVHIVNNTIKNTQVGYYTLTEVKVTKDLSFATIYYSILSDEKEMIQKSLQLLDDNKVKLRMELAKKIKNTRKIPDLIFKYDEALAYGNRIDKLLNEIKK